MLRDYVNSLIRLGYKIYELQHAYRINGIVDIYKSGRCVYDKRTNQYFKCSSEEVAIKMTGDLIKGTKPQDNFKKRKNGISYQEFSNNKMKFNAVEAHIGLDSLLNESHAEDYHWRNNQETSDSHMYMIFHRDTVKIGKSKDVAKRVKELSTALSHDVTVFIFPGRGHMETKMHQIFKEYRTSREWFTTCHRIKRFANIYGEKTKNK
jgi:hypothetical protein